MIVDNADDATAFRIPHTAQVPQRGGKMQHATNISHYLPHNVRGSIWITSRDKNTTFRRVGKDEHILKINPMGADDTELLLKKKLPNDQ